MARTSATITSQSMPLLRGTWRKRRRGGGGEEGGHLSLAAHEAVLLAVVEPVAGAARPDYTLQLVGLHLVAVAVLVEVVGGGRRPCSSPR